MFDGLKGKNPKNFTQPLNQMGFLETVSKMKNNIAEEVCSYAICLSRKLDPVTFIGRMKGKIIKPPKNQKAQWDQVFVPDGFNKTVSKMNLEEMG